MARPREFDEEAAVDRAMHTFWVGGYAGTSTEQLCNATGLGRSSIYNTFVSKHELFKRSLERYFTMASQAQLGILERPGSARERLHRMLIGIVDDEFDNGHRGCMAVNTAVELGGRDDEVSAALRRDAARTIAAICAVAEEGQRSGEIDPGSDARAVARFVYTQIRGIRLSARVGTSRAALMKVVDVAMNAI
jgi:TetR/AcrR family transcriptional regulator, transcriptional repressor for nem operon